MLIECTEERLAAALEQIAADAWRRDGDPTFPAGSVDALAAAGALGLSPQASSTVTQWAAVRTVAAADTVVGRIFERHLEAVDHLHRQAPEPLRSDELDCIASGERILGVWDEDDEDDPAVIRNGAVHGAMIHAVGAGGLDRAVIATGGAFVYAEVRGCVEVDPSWRVVRGEPMSAGDRVEIRGAPVLAELTAWSEQAAGATRSRAEIRRVATWMGVIDAVAIATLEALADRTTATDAEALAVGRMAAARRTLDLWLADAAHQADADPEADLSPLAAQTRAAVAVIAGSVMQEAAVATGDAPPLPAFARARRELARVPGIERPDTALASAGRELLRRRRSR